MPARTVQRRFEARQLGFSAFLVRCQALRIKEVQEGQLLKQGRGTLLIARFTCRKRASASAEFGGSCLATGRWGMVVSRVWQASHVLLPKQFTRETSQRGTWRFLLSSTGLDWHETLRACSSRRSNWTRTPGLQTCRLMLMQSVLHRSCCWRVSVQQQLRSKARLVMYAWTQ